MMLPVLLDSAVRSLLLGCLVWSLLRVARVCDTRTETAIWTAVLIAALAMPLLSRHIPGIVLTLPHWPAPATAAAAAAARGALHAGRVSPPPSGLATWPALAWPVHHGQTCLIAAYMLGFSVCALRLAMGLLLTLRLYRRATPVQADWVESRNIRATAEISSPVSLAGAILLPADHGDWSPAKRCAVLAHEDAHIARGDFFVQLAAMIHRALFWFSPFAWWLQAKLAVIAETASDEAAIRRLNDRAEYAEILVEVSRRAQTSPLIVAMANSSLIQRRVEHILSEAPTRRVSRRQRRLGVALLALLAIAVAGAKTAVDPPAAPAPARAAAGPARVASAAKRPAVTQSSTPAKHPRTPASQRRTVESPPAPADHTYDPRALLDRVYTPKPSHVPAATVVHAGREFYIRSTETPVADVAVTYAMERRTH